MEKYWERAKPQFSYSVVLDGKTPIEYLLRDMDVTDGIGYKSNLQDTLLFRALTAKGAVRLRSVLGSNCCHSRNQWDQNKVYSLKSTNGDNLGPIYIPQQKNSGT
jgi:signal peptidase I